MRRREIKRGLLLWSSESREVNAVVRYTVADPYAVTLAYVDEPAQRTVCHWIDRGLLIDGLHEPTGAGLVRVAPHETGDYIELTLATDPGARPDTFFVA